MDMRALFLTVALTAVSCGKDPGTATPSDKATGAAKANQNAAKEPPKKKKTETTIQGKVTLSAPDAGPAAGGTFTLTLKETKRATGTLTLGDRTFPVSGFQEKENLRLWVASPPSDEDVRRGYLFGQKKGESYSGQLALSGSGGKPQIRGTWSAVLK